jgi:hypothetical protein
MRRYFESLRPSDRSAIDSVPDGLFLVRVDRVAYRWHAQKPYYLIGFAVLEPEHLAGRLITGRLYSTPRAMWKLSWFLRDFGYDTDLEKDEIDDQALVGLEGYSYTQISQLAMAVAPRAGKIPSWAKRCRLCGT